METSTIKMGNDEFILYIRKQHPKCQKTNDVLGKAIWIWIQKNANGKQLDNGKELKASWYDEPNRVNAKKLPASATQFKFQRALLPELYIYLDELGSK